jgi:hypothetical protein
MHMTSHSILTGKPFRNPETLWREVPSKVQKSEDSSIQNSAAVV